jgi:hypothetical protein
VPRFRIERERVVHGVPAGDVLEDAEDRAEPAGVKGSESTIRGSRSRRWHALSSMGRRSMLFSLVYFLLAASSEPGNAQMREGRSSSWCFDTR